MIAERSGGVGMENNPSGDEMGREGKGVCMRACMHEMIHGDDFPVVSLGVICKL